MSGTLIEPRADKVEFGGVYSTHFRCNGLACSKIYVELTRDPKDYLEETIRREENHTFASDEV